MNFIDQADKGKGTVGTYILTVCIVLLAFISGQLLSEYLAQKVLGFSFLEIPDNVNLNSLLILILIPFVFVFAGILFCVKYLHQRPILSVFTSRETFDWKRFFISFSLWGFLMVAFLTIEIFSGYRIEWNFNPATFFTLLLISVFLLPIQTTAEELFFRGYLLQGFRKVFPFSMMAIVLSGLIFGYLHSGNPEIEVLGSGILIYYISTGIFLGLLAHLDDGMELGMGYHAINNIFGALIVTNEWQAFHTDALFIDKSEPSFGWESYLTLLLVQPLLLILFGKIFRWKNWKSKLLN